MITGPNFLRCIIKLCFSKTVSQTYTHTQSYKQALLCTDIYMYISKIYEYLYILYIITSHKNGYYIVKLLLIVDLLRKIPIMLLSSSYDKAYIFSHFWKLYFLNLYTMEFENSEYSNNKIIPKLFVKWFEKEKKPNRTINILHYLSPNGLLPHVYILICCLIVQSSGSWHQQRRYKKVYVSFCAHQCSECSYIKWCIF